MLSLNEGTGDICISMAERLRAMLQCERRGGHLYVLQCGLGIPITRRRVGWDGLTKVMLSGTGRVIRGPLTTGTTWDIVRQCTMGAQGELYYSSTAGPSSSSSNQRSSSSRPMSASHVSSQSTLS